MIAIIYFFFFSSLSHLVLDSHIGYINNGIFLGAQQHIVKTVTDAERMLKTCHCKQLVQCMVISLLATKDMLEDKRYFPFSAAENPSVILSACSAREILHKGEFACKRSLQNIPQIVPPTQRNST